MGYDVEWGVLNSRYYGVPQNRERVFIVGHYGGTCGRKVFPIRENEEEVVQEESSEGLEQVAQTLLARQYANWDGNFVSYPKVAGTLTGGGNSGGLHSDMDWIGLNTVRAHSLYPRSSKTGEGGTGPLSKSDGTAYCLDTGNNQAISHKIHEDMKIRRLTPIECERLQGFPDNWTAKGDGFDKWTENISDTQRYKMLGNAVTVNVIERIAKELIKCGGEVL